MAMDAKLACKKARIELESLEMLNRELEIQIKQMEAKLSCQKSSIHQSELEIKDVLPEDYPPEVGRKHHVHRKRRLPGPSTKESHDDRMHPTKLRTSSCDSFIRKHHRYCKSRKRVIRKSSKPHQRTDSSALQLKAGSMVEIYESTISPWYTPDIPSKDESRVNSSKQICKHEHFEKVTSESPPDV
ncbi:hypothetical protein QAD02_015918 [Eretmocerus hayati]|uniref:Uncharacterized protein n=1 Tax=Eretmocerus hayati TaxID=131215 RepID=A0ACC2PAW8_9HYME|nr:hypothetical protein QAD02_015918 [Eretmocerus hayati]